MIKEGDYKVFYPPAAKKKKKKNLIAKDKKFSYLC